MGGVDTKDNEDQDKGSEKSESEEEDANDMDFVLTRHKPEINKDDVLQGDFAYEKDRLVDDLSEALERQMLNEAHKKRAISSSEEHLGYMPLNRSIDKTILNRNNFCLKAQQSLLRKRRSTMN